MRVLILSCNTGEGHNSCGKAIQESFLEQQIPCEMEDTFRFISKGISSFISFVFVRIYRHFPGLFRFGYEYSEKHPGVFQQQSGIYKLLTSGADRLYQFIQEGHYDTIICPHVFSALIMTDILRRHQPDLRTCFVATDYTCSPSCGESRLDTYFIPSEDLIEEFVRCGIPEERLAACGLPIRSAFYHAQDKKAAKEKLGLPSDCRHLMIMCGSMGCGPIRKVTKMLAQQLPENCYVSVICGTNEHLRKSLQKAFSGVPRVRAYGYVKDISGMMDSADLYLTKPGGISVTEAACKRLPMVFVNAVAGCESYNMRYFMERGVAVTARNAEDLTRLSVKLLKDEETLKSMTEAFPPQSEYSAAEQITRWMQNACTTQRS